MLKLNKYLIPGILLLLFAAEPAWGQEGAGELTVSVNGVKVAKGVVIVSLFDSEGKWLKDAVAVKKIKAGKGKVTFKIPPGTYAVSVIHDENKNGKLDMRWFPWPKPKEGSGASRNPRPRAGPPKWKSSKFKFDGTSKSISINVIYL